MRNKIELEKLKNNIRIFMVVLLIILYVMDFLVLANIIVVSLVITKIISYVFERLGV